MGEGWGGGWRGDGVRGGRREEGRGERERWGGGVRGEGEARITCFHGCLVFNGWRLV